MSEKSEAGSPGPERHRELCSHCGFPLDEYTHGARHFGTHTAHVEWYCRQRMRGEIDRLKAELAQQAEPIKRKPLTNMEILDGLNQLPSEDTCSWSFRRGVAFAERAHGIGRTK